MKAMIKPTVNIQWGFKISHASLLYNFGITKYNPMATRIACEGVNRRPSSTELIWIRKTELSPKVKTMVILVKRKKIRNPRNCIFHENLFPNWGKQILKESASRWSHPANCPIRVPINAMVADTIKIKPPNSPILKRKFEQLF